MEGFGFSITALSRKQEVTWERSKDSILQGANTNVAWVQEGSKNAQVRLEEGAGNDGGQGRARGKLELVPSLKQILERCFMPTNQLCLLNLIQTPRCTKSCTEPHKPFFFFFLLRV